MSSICRVLCSFQILAPAKHDFSWIVFLAQSLETVFSNQKATFPCRNAVRCTCPHDHMKQSGFRSITAWRCIFCNTRLSRAWRAYQWRTFCGDLAPKRHSQPGGLPLTGGQEQDSSACVQLRAVSESRSAWRVRLLFGLVWRPQLAGARHVCM